MTADPATPRPLTDQQQWVRAICDAFGWTPQLKAGHAATLAKKWRTKVGATWQEFECHYGRVDPGAGVWWVYREVYPCDKLGKFPTPAIVDNSYRRWELATAVLWPKTGAGALLAYAQELRTNGNHSGSD